MKTYTIKRKLKMGGTSVLAKRPFVTVIAHMVEFEHAEDVLELTITRDDKT